jgi:hypothetical protein
MNMIRIIWLDLPAVFVTVTASGSIGHAQQPPACPVRTTIDGRYLPPPPQKFEGEINLNAAQSKPAWPARPWMTATTAAMAAAPAPRTATQPRRRAA